MPRVVHFEIPATDPKKIADFYASTFGWKIEQWGGENYWLASTGDKTKPGIDGAIYPKDWMDSVVNTIDVENLEDSIEKIKANGGEMVTDIREIPDVGRHAYFKDPNGNLFGVMQSFPGAMA